MKQRVKTSKAEQRETQKPGETSPDIAHAETQLRECQKKYIRALADYQNLEKRTSQEKIDISKYATETFLQRLLPVVDTFERAQRHLKDPGLAMALKELYAAFGEFGVERIGVLRKQFDPHEMECVEVAGEGGETVIEEVEPGYTLHGKVIRAAKVKVGK